MRKLLTISLLALAIIVTLTFAARLLKTAGASAAQEDPRRAAFVAALSPELVVPQVLPATIDDPHMLEAWIRLYNHQDAITLWDGSTTSGRALAQYLLDRDIPVVWDIQNVCHGSCSVRYCRSSSQTCGYEDGQPGVEPILVHVLYADDIPSLVLILAHEIFHRTQPFGPVKDTRFEEYWAFRLEAQITPAGAMNFNGFNPLSPAELDGWLHTNQLDGYMALPQYPPKALAPVASAR
jgi:hypothetical protein